MEQIEQKSLLVRNVYVYIYRYWAWSRYKRAWLAQWRLFPYLPVAMGGGRIVAKVMNETNTSVEDAVIRQRYGKTIGLSMRWARIEIVADKYIWFGYAR